VTYVIIGIAIVIALQVLVLLRSGKTAETGEAKEVRDELRQFRKDATEESRATRKELLDQQTSSFKTVTDSLKGVNETIGTQMKEIREGNEKKLEQMRKTVDEKLHETLEKRLGESFKTVSEQLDRVHKGIGEMQKLASDVGDLKKVMTNVKDRGGFGEVKLEAILEDMMAPGQYMKNVKTKEGSNAIVEFAVVLPGTGSEKVLLPIDAKYPTSDYSRLVDASQAGDLKAIEESVKAIANRLKGSAKDISEKYIDPPHTTDFAIMFLPSEGLYAEALRIDGLADELRQKHHIVITGPTTIAALLNSFRMGFQTLAIEKRSSEVWKVLGAVKAEFKKFGGVLDKLGKQLSTAQKTIEESSVRTRAMTRKLKDVQELPGSDAVELLELSEEAEE
jgi:DNA recombination protein RmuC